MALETLKIYEERDILGHVPQIAPGFQRGLRELGEQKLVGEARGKGLVGALELVEDKAARKNFDPALGAAAYVGERAQAHGVITRCLGHNLNLLPAAHHHRNADHRPDGPDQARARRHAGLAGRLDGRWNSPGAGERWKGLP